MWHVPGYLGLCLFPVHNTSDTVAVYFRILLSLSTPIYCLLLYSTFFLSNTIAGVPSYPPPSIFDASTSPVLPHCGVCFNVPSPALPLPASTTPQERRIIHKVLEIWHIPKPKPYQLEAIACLCFSTKGRLYLVHKTGEGKSAVVLASATIFRGITLVLVPLLGLGCDQVAKATRREQQVEAYHLDKH
jgi:hypothetical protein